MSIMVFSIMCIEINVQAIGSSDAVDENAPIVELNKETEIAFNILYKVIIPEDGVVDVDYRYLGEIENHITSVLLKTKDNKEVFCRESSTTDVDAGATWGIKAGTYYLYAKLAINPNKTNCVVKLNYSSTFGWEKEGNNDLENATGLVLGKPINGTCSYKYDTDYYKFTVDAPGSVSINMNLDIKDLPECRIPNVYLYDAESRKMFDLSTEYIKEGSASPKIGISAGTYYLWIGGGFLWGGLDNVYVLKVNYIANDLSVETEINDSFVNANNVILGNMKYGMSRGPQYIDEEPDVDFYMFTLDRRKYVKLSFIFDKCDFYWWIRKSFPVTSWKIQLYNESRVLQDEYSGSLSYSNWKVEREYGYLEPGKYYVVIKPYNWDELNVSWEHYSLCLAEYTPQLSKVKVNKLSSPLKKKVQVKWKLLENVNGYEISIATNKKFTKNLKKVCVGVNKDTYVFKKLKRKKKYFVRMRSYLDYDGYRHYGEYSKVKSVKLK